MLYSSIAIAALTSLTAAFPTIPQELADADIAALETRQTAPDPNHRFNAKKQYVSNKGVHKFVAPDLAGGDQRGPCPGLNAMANHGYIPHNGVATHAEFIAGTFKAFGMSTDLSGFLTVLGGTVDGNGLKWSIGGPSKAAAPLFGALGQPQGLSGSHNNYECDVSPGRGDLYKYGNDFVLQMSQYQILYDMAIENGDNVDLPLLTDFRSKRWDDSVATNPYFFNGPFTGIQVQPAAFTFIYRFMSNKSAEHPQGVLDTKIMNSFFGVEKKNGKLSKIGGGGYEKFPDNWYKRAIGDEYSIPFFQADLVLAGQKYPKFFSVGGNQGKVNTFTGVDPSDISGGVYNGKNLAQGDNAICFSSQFLKQGLPDSIKCSGAIANIENAMSRFTTAFDKAFGSFNCPQIKKVDNSQFDKFPGYKNLDCKTGKYITP